jgi:hypothetical protein
MLSNSHANEPRSVFYRGPFFQYERRYACACYAFIEYFVSYIDFPDMSFPRSRSLVPMSPENSPHKPPPVTGETNTASKRKHLKSRQESQQKVFQKSHEVPADRDAVARYFNSPGDTDDQLHWKVRLRAEWPVPRERDAGHSAYFSPKNRA